MGMALACSAEPYHPRLDLGPEAGIYLPVSGKAQDRFGASWLSLGVGFGGIVQPRARGTISGDFALLNAQSGDNHAWLVPVGVSDRWAIAGSASSRLYVGASASLYFTDIRSDEDGVASRIRSSWGGSAFAGVAFGRQGFVEARFSGVSRIRGIDLSGVSISAGYRF